MRRFDCDRLRAAAVALILLFNSGQDSLCIRCGRADEKSASVASVVPHERNSLGMTLVKIAPGSFLMGASDQDAEADVDERPQHRVTIERAFWLGAHEVTQAQYEAVMGENPSWFAPQGGGADRLAGLDHKRLPVDMISWHDTQEFCRRLGQLPAERAAMRRYRLPTEAEWEYACRAGTTTRFSSGDHCGNNHAWLAVDGAVPGSTRPVGTLQPNAWGLFDMHGNVWEWCADAYRFDAYKTSPESETTVDGGTGHVVRGGDWRSTPQAARASNRDFTRATRRDLGNGLRVVMELGAETH